MAITISNAAAVEHLTIIKTEIDSGASAATMVIYGGAVPGLVDDLASTTILATVVLAATAFGAVTDDAANSRATMVLSAAPAVVQATQGGTASHFRIFNGAATPVAAVQGTAGLVGSGEDAEFNSLVLVAGADVTLQTCRISVNE